MGVVGVMRRKGLPGFLAENTLWHSLFGLLFWYELFESKLLHSSFDWVPHCIKDRGFPRRFAAQIDVKLDAVRYGSAPPNGHLPTGLGGPETDIRRRFDTPARLPAKAAALKPKSFTGERAGFQTFATKLADTSAGRSLRLP